jgi:hypothetical protein
VKNFSGSISESVICVLLPVVPKNAEVNNELCCEYCSGRSTAPPFAGFGPTTMEAQTPNEKTHWVCVAILNNNKMSGSASELNFSFEPGPNSTLFFVSKSLTLTFDFDSYIFYSPPGENCFFSRWNFAGDVSAEN